MKGLRPQTEKIFMALKEFEFIKEYTLIGGTALSLQIQNRLSEDLDFCKWQDKPGLRNKEIEWPKIEKLLRTIGPVETNIFDLFQIDFFVDDVKVSFYSNSFANSRGIQCGDSFGNINLTTIPSLGAMKLEVMLRRYLFRDYYDFYSILKEGYSLKNLVKMAGKYSKHNLKTKNILSILSDGSKFKKEENFSLLDPKYNVNSEEIQDFILSIIRKEFNRRKQ